MSKMSFYAWGVTKEAEDLIGRMAKAIQSMIPANHQVETRIVDVASYGDVEHSEGWGLVFGTKTLQHVSYKNRDKVIVTHHLERLLPSENNQQYRAEATAALRLLAEKLKEGQASTEEEVKTYVLTKEGVTVGEKDTDIEISEKTLVYLKKIKDFLDGSKVVITKGNIRVEVE
jgi:hypothetical protein